jgi:hypothetical protein
VDEPEFLVRDRNGNIVRVNFDRDQQAILTDLVEGNTLCVMYAHRDTKFDRHSVQGNWASSSCTDLACSTTLFFSNVATYWGSHCYKKESLYGVR